jgi:hypothetical protein
MASRFYYINDGHNQSGFQSPLYFFKRSILFGQGNAKKSCVKVTPSNQAPDMTNKMNITCYTE